MGHMEYLGSEALIDLSTREKPGGLQCWNLRCEMLWT